MELLGRREQLTRRVVGANEYAATHRTTHLLGGKACSLIQLQAIGQPVPPFYVVTTQALQHALESAGLCGVISDALSSAWQEGPGALKAVAARIAEWMDQLPLPQSLVEDIRRVHEETFTSHAVLAVRSSAGGEDSAEHSFAGIHGSVCNVQDVSQVLRVIQRVWASLYSERALTYRYRLGLSVHDMSMAVVVQQMIDADRSGVMFTCDPATENPLQIVINSVVGAAEAILVAGLPSDTYTIDKSTLEITRQIADKPAQLVAPCLSTTEFTQVAVADDVRHRDSLTDEQIRLLVRAGVAIERHFGRPQDIEFCYDAAGQLFIVQSRPVTGIRDYGPAAGNRLLWDNSNIVESYSGVTSPMTFSFIRHVYTIVYHCFATVMGVRPQVVRSNRETFENMLGLLQGRVYYNLGNWYRALRMFPGFQYNREFMESMMGVQESLILDDPLPRSGFMRRWFVELPALVHLLLRSCWKFLWIGRITQRFEESFRAHYEKWSQLDFHSLPPHQLMALYHQMEQALLWNWKAPIINDFFVMIFYGLLKKLCKSWCDDSIGSLQNDLLCGEGGVESAAPTHLLLRMSKMAYEDPALRAVILHRPLESLPIEVSADPRFQAFNELMQQYMTLFGFRCSNELKLEEFSMRDQPHLVYKIVRNYLLLDDPAVLDVATIESRERAIRKEAERQAFAAVARRRGLLPRTLLFRWVLRNARIGVKNRENMRFARTRIFGLFREMLRSLGAQLANEQILADREDIFYLTIDEVWDYVKGTAVTTDLRGLVRLRRREFDAYRSSSDKPDSRFYTFGMAYHRNSFRNYRVRSDVPADGVLRGVGCCPGSVTGPVRIVHDPHDDVRLAGEILVAERTDPGWVPLYPLARGILIERGSVLSHSAVVAREMGIPTIVGIRGLMSALANDSMVRMDGRAGTIEILAAPQVTAVRG